VLREANLPTPRSFAPVTQISSAAANELFAIASDGTIEEFGPNVPGGSWWTYTYEVRMRRRVACSRALL
jgi:hypothetical protein